MAVRDHAAGVTGRTYDLSDFSIGFSMQGFEGLRYMSSIVDYGYM